MFKQFLIFALLILLMPQAFARSELVLNLDDPVNVQLLPSSQYYLDTNERQDFSSIADLGNQKWTHFDREQFQLGLTTGSVWVKTTFRTVGISGQDVAVKLHSSMDSQQIQISTRGEESQRYSFGLGSETDHYHDDHDHTSDSENHNSTKLKSDHADIRLAPNKTYFLYLKSDSSNPVIGDLRILNHQQLVSEGKFQESWLYIYLI